MAHCCYDDLYHLSQTHGLEKINHIHLLTEEGFCFLLHVIAKWETNGNDSKRLTYRVRLKIYLKISYHLLRALSITEIFFKCYFV